MPHAVAPASLALATHLDTGVPSRLNVARLDERLVRRIASAPRSSFLVSISAGTVITSL
jgi:hypothetical protein